PARPDEEGITRGDRPPRSPRAPARPAFRAGIPGHPRAAVRDCLWHGRSWWSRLSRHQGLRLVGGVVEGLLRGLLAEQGVLEFGLEDLADLVVAGHLRALAEFGEGLLGDRDDLRVGLDDLRVVVGGAPAGQRVLRVLVLVVGAGEEA